MLKKGCDIMNIRVGVKVKILPNAGYRNAYQDEFGVVERCDPFGEMSTIGVRLDNRMNPSSSYGVYWFNKNKVEIIESEDDEIMLKGFKVAGISFLEGVNTKTVYAYALYDDNIAVNDIVIVQSGHHGLGIAKVVSISDDALDVKHVQYGREIIAKVDFTAYEERKKKEERIKDLKKQMDAKVRELQNNAVYEMLAEKDPALKEMLDEFKTLIN